jgi:hypothetical protein
VGGVAVAVGAVDALVDPEQAASANVIVTTSNVMPQRITRSCVNRERVEFAAHILSPTFAIHCLRIHLLLPPRSASHRITNRVIRQTEPSAQPNIAFASASGRWTLHSPLRWDDGLKRSSIWSVSLRRETATRG